MKRSRYDYSGHSPIGTGHVTNSGHKPGHLEAKFTDYIGDGHASACGGHRSPAGH